MPASPSYRHFNWKTRSKCGQTRDHQTLPDKLQRNILQKFPLRYNLISIKLWSNFNNLKYLRRVLCTSGQNFTLISLHISLKLLIKYSWLVQFWIILQEKSDIIFWIMYLQSRHSCSSTEWSEISQPFLSYLSLQKFLSSPSPALSLWILISLKAGIIIICFWLVRNILLLTSREKCSTLPDTSFQSVKTPL